MTVSFHRCHPSCLQSTCLQASSPKGSAAAPLMTGPCTPKLATRKCWWDTLNSSIHALNTGHCLHYCQLACPPSVRLHAFLTKGHCLRQRQVTWSLCPHLCPIQVRALASQTWQCLKRSAKAGPRRTVGVPGQAVALYGISGLQLSHLSQYPFHLQMVMHCMWPMSHATCLDLHGSQCLASVLRFHSLLIHHAPSFCLLTPTPLPMDASGCPLLVVFALITCTLLPAHLQLPAEDEIQCLASGRKLNTSECTVNAREFPLS